MKSTKWHVGQQVIILGGRPHKSTSHTRAEIVKIGRKYAYVNLGSPSWADPVGFDIETGVEKHGRNDVTHYLRRMMTVEQHEAAERHYQVLKALHDRHRVKFEYSGRPTGHLHSIDTLERVLAVFDRGFDGE